MIIFLLVTVTFAWLGSRYIKWKREQQLLADLGLAISEYPNAVSHDDDIFESYSLDRLFKIADKYLSLIHI